MAHILVVEDELVIRTSLKKLLEKNGHEITLADSVENALQQDLSRFSLIISDLRLPKKPGTYLIKEAGKTPVLMMTSYASLRSAVDSMKAGAVDYIAKPFDHDDLLHAVNNILHNHETAHKNVTVSEPPKTDSALNAFIGDSPAMHSVYSQIRRVAQTKTTVLVNGQTGTGKELVAKAIHSESDRAAKPIVSVNCAAIPETLIESELFGYEKGAFTGANASRGGLIEAAEGGTLFLDEIGELPLQAQARLLRFLQEGEIRAVGSLETKKVNVRLVAATHRNLKTMAEEGDFREDLFYRIAVFPIQLPPLSERGKDILELAEAFLSEYLESFNKSEIYFSPKAVQAITTYRWPGNIRELRNAIERATILTDSGEISYEALGIDIELVNVGKIRQARKPVVSAPEERINTSTNKQPTPITTDPVEDVSLEDYFQRFVLEHQQTMSETELAKKLGISRKCLWERRQRFEIPRTKAQAAGKIK